MSLYLVVRSVSKEVSRIHSDVIVMSFDVVLTLCVRIKVVATSVCWLSVLDVNSFIFFNNWYLFLQLDGLSLYISLRN